MKIVLASDHSGYEQLKTLQSWLEQQGHNCLNLGPASLDPGDDYNDFIIAASRSVIAGDSEKGIIMGGSGQGEAMAANRYKGIRCAVFYAPAVARGVVDATGRVSHDPYEIIKLSRLHNDSNMLSLAARFLTVEDMKNAVKVWLDTPFSNEERHTRRNNKLDR
jgi:ribose 5-phosphate isomerase B